MNVLHILASGGTGGIEVLLKDFIKYSKHNNRVMFLWEEGLIAEEMKCNCVEIIHLHAESNNPMSVIRSVIKYCKKSNIDVVIAHHAAPLSHMCLLLIKYLLPHIRRIAYAHGNASLMYREDDKRGLWIRKQIMSSSLKKADKVIAISNSVKSSLITRLSTPESSIQVIYNGVDISRFKNAKTKNNAEARIIYVGRLIEGKGVQLIIEALKSIEQAFRFDIVGDGEYRISLERLVEQYELQNKVVFWGARTDVPSFLMDADIFVHVPLFEEGFGITIVEAMASGLICVCSKSGGIPELIEHGSTGYLVEKNSVEELRKILEYLMNDFGSEVQEEIKIRAKDSVERFSIDEYVNILDNIIEKI